VVGEVDTVKWSVVSTIVASWVVSPLLSGTIAFLLIRSVQKFILNAADPCAMARKYVPVYMFFTGFMIAMITLVKRLKYVGLQVNGEESILYAVVALFVRSLLVRIKHDPDDEKYSRFESVERIFAVLMIFTACAMALAHGSNDVANAVDPLAAVVAAVDSGVKYYKNLLR